MIIKSIRIRHSGGAPEGEYHALGSRLALIQTRYGEELAAALAVISGNTDTYLSPRIAGRVVSAEAEVSAGGREYTVRAEITERGARLTAARGGGADATAEYRYLTAHSREEDLCDGFDGDDAEGAPRLLKYTAEERFYAPRELENATRGATKLGFFRKHLRSFIRHSAPEPIREGKRYELVLGDDGEYSVRVRDGDFPALLSEAEERIFAYLCFLKTAEFWQGFEEIRNLGAVKKPLTVRHFIERIDEGIDLADIFKRTAALERQAIILTLPRESRHTRTITELGAILNESSS